MVTISTSDAHPLQVKMDLDTPSVYLDQCVIGDFAEVPEFGTACRQAILTKGGTLCISALHLVEMSGLCPGATYSRMKDFLASFGNRFAILEYDPNVVLTREQGPKQLRPRASLDFELTKELLCKWNGLSEINLGILFEILERNSPLCQSLRDAHAYHKSTFYEDVGKLSHAYRTDMQVKKRVIEMRCPNPTESNVLDYLYCHVRRTCVREGLTQNDTIDFFHSLVSVSYMDFVVLDKKWASRMRRIPTVPGMARIFATNEYDEFLRTMAA